MYVLDDEQVLKVTCCPATVLLFDEFLAAAVPRRLPMVFECIGPVAEDIEGAAYVGLSD